MTIPNQSPRGPQVNQTGVEPFSSRFLSAEDLRNIAGFKDDISDKSLSTRVLSPPSTLLAKVIPSTTAPNVLTLMSLVAVLHACHNAYMYRDEWPRLTVAVSIVMFTLYQILDAVDGKHAKNILNDTPLGYVFNQACDAIAITFITLTVCLSLGISDMRLMWLIVQSGHLVFMWQKISALTRGYISYGLFTGPGEALFVFNLLLGLRAMFGMEWLIGCYKNFVVYVCVPLLKYVPTDPQIKALLPQELETADPAALGLLFSQALYYMLVLTITVRCFFLPATHKYTRNYLLFCLLYRTVPSLLFRYAIARSVTIQDIICDGLFMSIVTTDLTVARMAKREMHDWIVIMAMASLLDKFLNLFMTVFYFTSIFYDVCTFMNLPMFTPVINVYIDGVFDLCHLGHKNHIMRALKYGNRLLVGVMSDEDVRKYKRDPIMTLEERCAEVEALRCVYQVIPGAPCFGLSEEFIRKWKIHVVLASPEYDKPQDNYYRIPRQLGLLKIMPRTDGVSTSEIIQRIRLKYKDDPAPKEGSTIGNGAGSSSGGGLTPTGLQSDSPKSVQEVKTSVNESKKSK